MKTALHGWKVEGQKKDLKFQKEKEKTFGNFGLVSNLLSSFEKLKEKKNNIKGGLDWNPLYTLFQT